MAADRAGTTPPGSLHDRALARLVKFPAGQYEGGLAESAVLALIDAEKDIDALRESADLDLVVELRVASESWDDTGPESIGQLLRRAADGIEKALADVAERPA